MELVSRSSPLVILSYLLKRVVRWAGDDRLCQIVMDHGSYERLIAIICSPAAAVNKLPLKLVSQRMRLVGRFKRWLRFPGNDYEEQELKCSFHFRFVSDTLGTRRLEEDRINDSKPVENVFSWNYSTSQLFQIPTCIVLPDVIDQ